MTATGCFRRLLAAAVTTTLTATCVYAGSAVASESSRCSLGGPTPAMRAIRVDLPHGSNGMSLQVRAPSQAGRRLVEGAFLLSEQRRIIAFALTTDGVQPHRTTVRVGGADVVNTPDSGVAAPFGRTASAIVPDLKAGRYYLVGFGVGSATQWGADLQIVGAHVCAVLDGGETFDIDASQSAAHTLVDSSVATTATSAAFSWHTSHNFVVGVVQATHELVGHARIDCRTPTGRGSVIDTVEPFVSSAGAYRWIATATAALPVLDVAGAAISLPS